MIAALLALALGAPCGAAGEAPPSRVVSLGGAVTETVVALGARDRLIGVDDSSVYPPEVAALPRVGFHRTFSAEGVIALAPSLVLMTSESGPPAAVEQLRAAGIAEIVVLDTDPSPAGAIRRIRSIAAALGEDERGAELSRALERDFAAAASSGDRAKARPPRVLFLYAHGARSLLVSGRGTAAAAMIGLAGGENAVTAYEGYRPLTPEAAIAAAPDVILVTESGLASCGGEERLFDLPGIALTPAARNRRVVAFDSLALLGFGPRAGRVAVDLGRALREEGGGTAARAAAGDR